jgi:hypothetical protein
LKDEQFLCLLVTEGMVGSYLGEADVLGLLTEALTAQVQVVLADQTGRVLADAAESQSC